MKKKSLYIIAIFITAFLIFKPEVKAVVMWMQCTATADGEMYHNNSIGGDDEYKKYNTIALINEKDKGVRNVFYTGNDFFGVNGPQFLMYRSHNGQTSSDACWYNSEYKKGDQGAHGRMNECDKESDIVEVSKLTDGNCPNAIYQTTGWDTAGGVKGDFVILQGVTVPSNNNVETLTSPKLVIYQFGNEQKKYTMIEAYNTNGVYGTAYTFNGTYKELASHIGLSADNDSNGDLITSNYEEYDQKFVNWTMYTQLVRLAKLGRNYYKITETDAALLINAGAGGDYKVIEGSQLYSDKGSIWPTVQEWYDKNNEKYINQINKMKEFEAGGKYKKLVDTANEISNAVDNGTRYTFSSSYDSTTMVKELESAYKELNDLISTEEMKFESYDKNCNESKDSTSDAMTSLHNYFNCKTFGTSNVENLKGKNMSTVENVLLIALDTQLSSVSSSNISLTSLRSNAENYIKTFAKAAAYLKSNGLIDANSTLVNNYTELARSFGSEIVVDCQTLLGADIVERLKEWAKGVKIVVPLLLMTFGILDFSKAVFSNDEEKMKKAKDTFIKRVIIAICFFLVPTLVNLLLSLANQVWTVVSPDSCGIF